jgi:hypothetical protein
MEVQFLRSCLYRRMRVKRKCFSCLMRLGLLKEIMTPYRVLDIITLWARLQPSIQLSFVIESKDQASNNLNPAPRMNTPHYGPSGINKFLIIAVFWSFRLGIHIHILFNKGQPRLQMSILQHLEKIWTGLQHLRLT